MALPYEQGKAFIRMPDKYPYDAFGVDTGGRKIPHSGIDVTPARKGDTSAYVLSVNGGIVKEQGWDKESGNYIIIAENDGGFWGYGHNSKNLVRAGTRVAAGQRIATFGATGGAFGVHCHIWRAKTLAAALRIVHGYTNYKSGRTTKAWADSMGLTDPLPYILKAAVANSAPAQDPVPTPTTDDVVLGSTLRLQGWRGYTTNTLSVKQDALLSGDFQVIGIVHGNFKIRGNGREAWVANAAKAGLVGFEPAPTPAPTPTKTPEQIEEEELMAAKDDIINTLKAHIDNVSQSRTRADTRGYVFLDLGENGDAGLEQASHAVLIGSGGMMVLHPPVKSGTGQIKSLTAPGHNGVNDYRWLDTQRWSAPMSTGRFINRVKDSLTYFDPTGKVWTADDAWAWIAEREAILAKQA